MVVFVDLDGDDEESSDSYSGIPHAHDHAINTARFQKLKLEEGLSRPSPITVNIYGEDNSTESPSNDFSAALSCYPIALSLAPHLDLTDLDSLSRTSHRIRISLNQFAANLTSHSLRCANDSQPLLADLIEQYNISLISSRNASQAGVPAIPAANALPNVISALSNAAAPVFNSNTRLLQSGKLNPCARDLVADCRKCGNVVCRNCRAKPLSDKSLGDRHRRLCRVCLDAPLSAHLVQARKEHDIGTLSDMTPPSSSASSARSVRSNTTFSISSDESGPAFTHQAFQRSPCTCETRGVYLCNQCGQNLRAADTTYKRVWTWRSRYSTHIGGGLGTGLGEGDQGQKCARGEDCLDQTSSGTCWIEIDCSEEEGGERHRERGEYINADDPAGEKRRGGQDKPGYHRQEIEGIGGVVKKKVKKRVRVGATVWEYDDERESGKYLEREASGKERSWCGWCSRVVLSEKDKEDIGYDG